MQLRQRGGSTSFIFSHCRVIANTVRYKYTKAVYTIQRSCKAATARTPVTAYGAFLRSSSSRVKSVVASTPSNLV